MYLRMEAKLFKEQLVRLSKSRSLFPDRPQRKTLESYWKNGCEGVKLATVRLPNGRFTSKEAISRFLMSVARNSERKRFSRNARNDKV